MNKSSKYKELEKLLCELVVEQEKYDRAIELGHDFEEVKEIYLKIKSIKDRLAMLIPELRAQAS